MATARIGDGELRDAAILFAIKGLLAFDGYEDLVDHDQLRHDPVMAWCWGGSPPGTAGVPPLAGKSTLNRLEHGTAMIDRYRRIAHEPPLIERLFVDFFLDAHGKPPKEILLDLDATDDPPMPAMGRDTRKASSSTATTTATATCRSTSSAADICWRRSCGARTSMPLPGRSRRWHAASDRSAPPAMVC